MRIIMKYTTRGVCSRSIEFDVVDNKVTGVKLEGGGSGDIRGERMWADIGGDIVEGCR
jgi:hypothetical protein